MHIPLDAVCVPDTKTNVLWTEQLLPPTLRRIQHWGYSSAIHPVFLKTWEAAGAEEQALPWAAAVQRLEFGMQGSSSRKCGLYMPVLSCNFSEPHQTSEISTVKVRCYPRGHLPIKSMWFQKGSRLSSTKAGKQFSKSSAL